MHKRFQLIFIYIHYSGAASLNKLLSQLGVEEKKIIYM